VRKFYSTKQLSEIYTPLLTESFLKKSRMDTCTVDGPPFIKHGRKVVYEYEAVTKWIAGLGVVPKKPAPLGWRPGRPTKAQQVARRASAG